MTWWRRMLLGLRWWFGSTWVLGGLGAVIAGPIMIATGNWGGVYMIGGGVEMAAMGWLLHPWGFARRGSRRPASAV